MTIEGPLSVAPQGTARYYATAHLSGGTLRDVTDEVIWHSTIQSVLTVDRTGTTTGHERGQTELVANYNGRSGTREVVVLEDGTYRLAGIVAEPRPVGLPVADARVEVTGGTGTGRISTTTAPDGRYALFGVAGPTETRVTKDGYQPIVISVNVAEHLTQDIELPLVRPRSDLSGVYTLTLSAASAGAPCVSPHGEASSSAACHVTFSSRRPRRAEDPEGHFSNEINSSERPAFGAFESSGPS